MASTIVVGGVAALFRSWLSVLLAAVAVLAFFFVWTILTETA
jgi:hypothetical protein